VVTITFPAPELWDHVRARQDVSGREAGAD
jgi:hypothetical protein